MNQELMDEVSRKLSAELFRKGQVLNAGRMLAVKRLAKKNDEREKELVGEAFMAGAQHLWACMLGGLDPGFEATAADERRMSMIHSELHEWARKALNRKVKEERH